MDYSPYVPASGKESEKFQTAINNIFWYGGAANIFLSYGLSVLFMQRPTVVDYIMPCPDLEFFCRRFAYLSRYDGVSHLSYAGTMVVSAASCAIVSFTVCTFYWNEVIKKNNYVPWRNSNIFGLIVYLLFAYFLLWPHIFKDIEIDPYTGMAAIFLWPAFPAYGSLAVLVVSALAFVPFGAFCKIFLNYFGNSSAR